MERIILDVDTGHDDAVAIELASAFPDAIRIEGLVAVSGNSPLENTLENTLNLADALAIDAPVLRGASRPLVRERVNAPGIHGANGFQGPVFGRRRKEADGRNFVAFIIDTVLASPGEVTYVSVGPYTDLALALRAEPRLAGALRRIVLMGGSSGRGNVTSSAEFNIYADPEAARVVLGCGAPIYMFPLDCTLQTVLEPETQKRLMGIGGRVVEEIFRPSMEFYIESCRRCIHDWPAMHDPCTIAWLLRPELFVLTGEKVEVDTTGGPSYGRTCLGAPDPGSNIRFARKVDAPRFWDLLAEAFENHKKRQL